jgi:replicative DNA helicase
MGDRLTFVPSPLTVPALTAEVARTGAKLLVVDYLQLVKGEGTNKVEELDGIVDELQRLAVARGVAVVVISSMAKATGQQARAHEWARGSGQIGYALKLLYVGERDEHADQDGTYGFKWVCRKARSIPQTDVKLRWDSDLQTFSAAERPDEAFAAFAPGRPR